MRLHSVKICGFKSFADPVDIKMDVPLLCILGPNGCGKSNIVEAITWVMGESRASMVRGESMQNVVFNGSATRKPMDWCSVEMRLDNSDDSGHDLKAWSGYPELVIKRELERDGNSTYRINGQVVRRKDVNDLFSGTGLGAHGYSVVLQGMIARIVEDNPAHIRVYLEEAAGVTHYKVRRRETEVRLGRAEENQERLENLREELAKQVAALKRQASAALRYRALGEEIAQLRRISLEWRKQEIGEKLVALAGARAEKAAEEQRLARDKDALNKEMNALREQHKKKLATQQEIQSRAYKMSASVARVTQQLESLRLNRQERLAALAANKKTLEELGAQRKRLLEEKSGCATEQESAAKELREVAGKIADAEARAKREGGEAELKRKGHEELEGQVRQREHLLQTKEMQLSIQDGQAQALRESLEGVEAKLDEIKASLDERENAKREVAEAAKAVAALQKRREEREKKLEKQRVELARLGAESDALRTEAVKNETENAFLMSVGGGLGEDAKSWAKKRGIDQRQELLEQVKIDAKGWEGAVDAALGERTSAYLVDDPWSYAADGGALPSGLGLIARASARSERPSGRPLEPLASKIECAPEWEGLIALLLAGFYAAADLPAARAALPSLGPGEHMVTPKGELLSANSVRAQPELRRGYGWSKRIGQLKRDAGALSKKADACDRKIASAKKARDALDGELAGLAGELEAAAELQRKAGIDAAAVNARSQMALEQGKELKAQVQSLRSEQRKAARSVAELEASAAEAKKWLENHRREVARSAQALEKEAARAAELAQKIELLGKERKRQEEIQHNAVANARVLDARLDSVAQRSGEIEADTKRVGEELEKMSETKISESKSEEEESLQKINAAAAAALAEVNQISEQVEARERRRESLDGNLAAARERVQQIGFEEATHRDEGARVDAQLAELAVEVDEAVRSKIPDSAAAAARMEALVAKRERLGDINFAAEAELEAAAEREADIEAQRKDVREAIENLTQAIERIDGEMLERLREVFGKVSDKFNELFRKAFGGGSASLETDGNSLLDAGVKIKASPPGKTIDRMHLLSGGEKSLVALAFILAIFSLNPAPFCVMDEVDAALDDRNTAMFNNLVKEFSSQVQFMIVTHNKITADVANRLVGVVQSEKGVSSLVTVKVSDVEKFVEAGEAA